MRIGFIGAGKVGFSLGKYFSEKGLNLSGYYSLNETSAQEAAEFTLSKKYEQMSELVSDSDFIFITTNDNEIDNVCNQLKEFKLRGKAVAHCSGSLSSKYFQDILSDAHVYSIHPMYPFSDKYLSYKNLHRATFTIEGSFQMLENVKSIISELGNPVIIINEEDKKIYHLANVYASNLYIALVSDAVKYLKSINITEEAALSALMPLMEANVENIVTKGITASLTGPVERGDTSTIAGHLECIMPEDKNVYLNLSKGLLKIAQSKNKDRDYSEIESVLEENI